jgi:hypothetical protein
MAGATGHRVRPQPPHLRCLFDVTLVFPLIFHSIKDEIPEGSQALITRLYQLWLVLAVTLILNMVACIMILIAGSRDGGRDTGASIGSVISAISAPSSSPRPQLPLHYLGHLLSPLVPVRPRPCHLAFPFLSFLSVARSTTAT